MNVDARHKLNHFPLNPLNQTKREQQFYYLVSRMRFFFSTFSFRVRKGLVVYNYHIGEWVAYILSNFKFLMYFQVKYYFVSMYRPLRYGMC